MTDNIFITGRTHSKILAYGDITNYSESDCFTDDEKVGYIRRYTGITAVWEKYFFPRINVEAGGAAPFNAMNKINGLPWVQLSRSAVKHTRKVYKDYLAFFLDMTSNKYIFLINYSDGVVQYVYEIAGTTQFKFSSNNLLFQLDDPTETSADLSKYRVYVGHVEDTSLDTLQLDSYDTTNLISVSSTTTTYSIGITSLLHIEDTIWFGGGIDAGGNKLLPILGKAPSSTLVVDYNIQFTPTGGDI